MPLNISRTMWGNLHLIPRNLGYTKLICCNMEMKEVRLRMTHKEMAPICHRLLEPQNESVLAMTTRFFLTLPFSFSVFFRNFHRQIECQYSSNSCDSKNQHWSLQSKLSSKPFSFAIFPLISASYATSQSHICDGSFPLRKAIFICKILFSHPVSWEEEKITAYALVIWTVIDNRWRHQFLSQACKHTQYTSSRQR